MSEAARRVPAALAATPNILTVFRLAAALAAPFLYALAARPSADWWLFGLFVAAMITDFADGWLARRFALESPFGRMLDPIADKAMVLSTLTLWLAILHLDSAGGLSLVAILPVTLILLRELVVSGLREHLGGGALRVSWLAKVKTAVQACAVGLLLFGQAMRAEGLADWTLAHMAGLAALWLAAVLTLASGADYVRAAWARMVKER